MKLRDDPILVAMFAGVVFSEQLARGRAPGGPELLKAWLEAAETGLSDDLLQAMVELACDLGLEPQPHWKALGKVTNL